MSEQTGSEAPTIRYETREQWLEAAIEALRPMFAQAGHPLPPFVYVSVGFGYSRAENKWILAQTLYGNISADGQPHVLVSPILGDAMSESGRTDVLGALVHELVHVASAHADGDRGHRGTFLRIAEDLGLNVERPTQALPGPALEAELMLLANQLGEYAHSMIDLNLAVVRQPVPVPAGRMPVRVTSGRRPQTARWIKVTCPAEGCTTTARMTRRQHEDHPVLCAAHMSVLQLAE